MLPTLTLIGCGRRRGLWLPLPTVLLWPLWALGWALWLPLAVLRAPAAERLRLGLLASLRLSGLRLSIKTRDGMRIVVRMI